VDIQVDRGKLRVDSSIGTNIVYIPRSRATPPPFLRQVAYAEGTPLLPPSIDPDGWHSVRPVKMVGSLFNSRKIEVTWKLSIAKPLEFARGAVIPLSLLLESEDTQALDLLGKAAVPIVALVRDEQLDTKTPESRLKTSGSKAFPASDSPVHNQGLKVLLPGETDTSTFEAVAVWWLPEDASAYEESSRRLDGEIHLPGPLPSSFQFWKVGVEYTVHLLAPTVTGFAIESNEGSLVSEKVKITTDKPLGVALRQYAPPGYSQTDAKNQLQNVKRFFTPNMRIGRMKGGGFL